MCCLRCFLRCFRLWHGSTSSRCSHGAFLIDKGYEVHGILRRSSSFGLGLVCVGHCLGLLLHARPQRPPGFAAVRYLCGNCRAALAWRAAQFGLAVSAIFRCVFFAFANAAVRRHARRRCAREVEVLPHLSGAVYLNSAAWQAACALNSAPQCRALAP